MKNLTKDSIKEAYSQVALNNSSCNCGSSCGDDTKNISQLSGYTNAELKEGGVDAYLGLSCGNPTAIAGLRKGETVLDLGSGGGFDCFLASAQVGDTGKVIGIDMTPEMISRAKYIAEQKKIQNVEFKLGEIENLPVEDSSIDVIMSNCVINLTTDKSKVYEEAFRVLKPGGRLSISDVVLLKPIPSLSNDNKKFTGCFTGAILISDYKKIVKDAGFKDIKINVKESFCLDKNITDPFGKEMFEGIGSSESLKEYIASVSIEGIK